MSERGDRGSASRVGGADGQAAARFPNEAKHIVTLAEVIVKTIKYMLSYWFEPQKDLKPHASQTGACGTRLSLKLTVYSLFFQK
jgi:hypothetical protein